MVAQQRRRFNTVSITGHKTAQIGKPLKTHTLLTKLPYIKGTTANRSKNIWYLKLGAQFRRETSALTKACIPLALKMTKRSKPFIQQKKSAAIDSHNVEIETNVVYKNIPLLSLIMVVSLATTNSLTHSMPLVSFNTLWKHQKTSGGYFRGYWKKLVALNGLKSHWTTIRTTRKYKFILIWRCLGVSVLKISSKVYTVFHHMN